MAAFFLQVVTTDYQCLISISGQIQKCRVKFIEFLAAGRLFNGEFFMLDKATLY